MSVSNIKKIFFFTDGSLNFHNFIVFQLEEGSIQLVNGEKNSSGRVEVFLNGVWGTVCDNQWDEVDALVVCCGLGFNGALVPRTNAYFGEGFGHIAFGDVQCFGTETSLTECRHVSSHDCVHSKDAGVSCIPLGRLSPQTDGHEHVILVVVLCNVCALVCFMILATFKQHWIV